MSDDAPDSRLEAVLFDMDGTLVDTEPYWIDAEYRLVESFGGTWSDHHAHAIVGNALPDSAAYIRVNGGVELDEQEIVRRLLDDVVAACRVQLPWRAEVRSLLGTVRAAGVPCALVTMSYARLAQAVVDAVGPGMFGAVVTGDQVRFGKPHPEPYLTAAARLGADPARSVAVEDSPTGIASARAAGCAVLAVPNQVPVPASADWTISRHPDRLTVSQLADLLG